jgi:hypothetical protein
LRHGVLNGFNNYRESGETPGQKDKYGEAQIFGKANRGRLRRQATKGRVQSAAQDFCQTASAGNQAGCETQPRAAPEETQLHEEAQHATA